MVEAMFVIVILVLVAAAVSMRLHFDAQGREGSDEQKMMRIANVAGFVTVAAIRQNKREVAARRRGYTTELGMLPFPAPEELRKKVIDIDPDLVELFPKKVVDSDSNLG